MKTVLRSISGAAASAAALFVAASSPAFGASITIDDTSPTLHFTFSGFATGAGFIQAGAPGGELAYFGGTISSLPNGYAAGVGEAYLSEPGNPGLASDGILIGWDAQGNVSGYFVSVDAGVPIGPGNVAGYPAYPETGSPVTITTVSATPNGTPVTVPFTLTINSSVPDAGATAVLFGGALAGLAFLRRRI